MAADSPAASFIKMTKPARQSADPSDTPGALHYANRLKDRKKAVSCSKPHKSAMQIQYTNILNE